MDKKKATAYVEMIVGFLLALIGFFGAVFSENKIFIVCLIIGASLLFVGLIASAVFVRKDRSAGMNRRMQADIINNMELAKEKERTEKK